MTDRKTKKELTRLLKKESRNHLVSVRSGSGIKMHNSPQGFFVASKRRGSGKLLLPWEPIFEVGEEEGSWNVRINLGTANGVVPGNWNELHNLGAIGEGFKFVILTVTSSSGQVSSCSISIDEAPPMEDFVDELTPPTMFKIVLGVVGAGVHRMIYTVNLNLVGTVVYVTSLATPAVSTEPFKRWWRWKVN